MDQQFVHRRSGRYAELQDAQVQRRRVVHQGVDRVVASGRDREACHRCGIQDDALPGEHEQHRVVHRYHSIPVRCCTDLAAAVLQAHAIRNGGQGSGIRSAGFYRATLYADVECGGEWKTCIPIVDPDEVRCADGEVRRVQDLHSSSAYPILTGDVVRVGTGAIPQVDDGIEAIATIHGNNVFLGGRYKAEPHVLGCVSRESTTRDGRQ